MPSWGEKETWWVEVPSSGGGGEYAGFRRHLRDMVGSGPILEDGAMWCIQAPFWREGEIWRVQVPSWRTGLCGWNRHHIGDRGKYGGFRCHLGELGNMVG